jgi:hypothetical protein
MDDELEKFGKKLPRPIRGIILEKFEKKKTK